MSRQLALPPPLAPWSAELEGLPLDVIHALSPWLDRLRGVLMLPGPAAQSAAGEVDGFDGLAPRGDLAHLLPSQWLLAEEFEDEFLRRAAEGELSFLRLARAAPRMDRMLVALFDTGPAQLGAPRLAHIALLVVMARRAREAGAWLCFGALQDPARTLHTALSPATLSALLEARSATLVTPAMVDAWLATLPPGVDGWLVGRPGAAGWGQVVVSHDPMSASLHLSLRAHGQLSRTLSLTLPEQQAGVRALRARFEQGACAVPPIVPPAAVLFARDGRRVLVKDRDGDLRQIRVPRHANTSASAALALEVPVHETLFAVQRGGRRLLALTDDGASLWLRGAREPRQIARPEGWVAPARSGVGACWQRREKGEPTLFFLDGGANLYTVAWRQAGARPERVESAVLATLMMDGLLRLVVHESAALSIRGYEHGGVTDTTAQLIPSADGHFFYCRCATLNGLTIATGAGAAWDIEDERRGALAPIAVDPDWSVLGMVPGERPALVAVDHDRERVALVDEDGIVFLWDAPSPVSELWCSALQRRFACLTQDEELIVVDGNEPTVLLCLHGVDYL